MFFLHLKSIGLVIIGAANLSDYAQFGSLNLSIKIRRVRRSTIRPWG